MEVLAILEALRVYVSLFHSSHIVESNSANAIQRGGRGPWKFQFLLNEIKSQAPHIPVEFWHVD